MVDRMSGMWGARTELEDYLVEQGITVALLSHHLFFFMKADIVHIAADSHVRRRQYGSMCSWDIN